MNTTNGSHTSTGAGPRTDTQGFAPQGNAGGFSGPGAWRGEGPGGGVARIGSLASGYGGLDLAVLDVFGGEVVWHAESDPDASRVLKAHWPGVPNLGDITAIDWTTVEPVDILTAGFPCQDISAAGRRAGMAPDTRSGLWTYVAQAIGALRPRLVVIENVAALLSTHANRTPDGTVEADGDVEPGPAGLGDGSDEHVLRALGAVLGDLAGIGFDAQWTSVAASDVGACHRRRRIFILAWPAADATRVGHGDEWPPLRERVSPAAVGGAVRPVDLLPTLAASNPNDGEDLDNWQARRDVLAERHGNNGFGMPLGVAVRLLPTPAARLGDSRGQPNPETAARRMDDEGRRNLDDAVALLPTPAARVAGRGSGYGDQPGRPLSETVMRLAPPLDPSVALGVGSRATDGSKGGPNQRGSSGDLMLPSAVMDLLPTPTVADSRGSRNATAGRSADAQPFDLGWTLSDVAHADRWGRYAPAIARWEQVLGRSAPDPTEAGTRGQPRLSPLFVEWLMGCPDGWVTSIVGRNAALRILGNGVVPQQGAHALQVLAADREAAK